MFQVKEYEWMVETSYSFLGFYAVNFWKEFQWLLNILLILFILCKEKRCMYFSWYTHRF